MRPLAPLCLTALIGFLGLLLPGCAPPEPSLEQHRAEMEMRRLPPADFRLDRGFDAAARAAGAPECRAACAGEPACAQACRIGAQDLEPRQLRLEDCLYCGRETGFLGTPRLALELIDKTASLSWSEVAGADRYIVYGLRWAEDPAHSSPVESHTWRAEGQALSLQLRAGTWSFYVVAYADQPKARSRRSNIVIVAL